eukprot:10358808-Ditylum_brightwellii.AAC.1
MFLHPAMGFGSFDMHSFFIVSSTPSLIHPHMTLSQDIQQQTQPSTTSVWDSKLVFQTYETQQNMPSLCQLPNWRNEIDTEIINDLHKT